MSLPKNPPQVQSGEVMTLDENGSSIYFKQDKSLIVTHGVKGGTINFDGSSGALTSDTKGAAHTMNTGGGAMNINTGGGMLSINS